MFCMYRPNMFHVTEIFYVLAYHKDQNHFMYLYMLHETNFGQFHASMI